MNLNNFTIKSQEALQQAQQIAAGLEQQSIEPAHIFQGMLEVDENVIPFILKKIGIKPDHLQNATDTLVRSYPKVSGARQYLSDESNKLVQKAISTAKTLGDEYVSLEHLFVALLGIRDRIS